ncbi:MAG: HAMP domain-containing sensor histidine kinase [Oscillospiraceae bacterium]
MKKAKVTGTVLGVSGFALTLAASVLSIFISTGYNFLFLIGTICGLALVCAGAFYLYNDQKKHRAEEQQIAAQKVDELETRLVTERAENEEKIQQSIAAGRDEIEKFRRVLSHQLRMPLSIVQGYVEILSKGIIEDEAVRQDYLEKILERTRSIGEVITRQFSVYRSSEEVPAVLRKVDIIHLLNRAGEDMQTIARSQGIKIQVLSTEDSFIMDADEEQLNKVVFNILENSIKYMGREGMITIYTELSDDKLTITFKDDGVGLEAEQTAHIFEADYQGSNKNGGNGLGLYLASRAAEAHGGTISAESDIGRGMTIRMTLPRYKVRQSHPVQE